MDTNSVQKKPAKIAFGKRKAPGTMNSTEADYQDELIRRQIAGEILWFKYEGCKLKLAEKTFFTPDFIVMLASGEIEMHEVKGFWKDDARVKIKVAADIFPFRFISAKVLSAKKGMKKTWAVEHFS